MPELSTERRPYYNASEIRERVDLRSLHSALGRSANGHTVVTSGQRAVVVECPFHDDSTPSLYLFHESDDPHYHCFACGAHGDCFDYVCNALHVQFFQAMEWIVERGLAGSTYSPIGQVRLPPPKASVMPARARGTLRVTKRLEHIYHDETGQPFSKLIRVYGTDADGKAQRFMSRRHPDPHCAGECKSCVTFWQKKDGDRPKDWANHHPGGWGYGDPTDRIIPYRLPELLRARGRTVFWPEGEKCVEAVESLGNIAITNPNGCAQTLPESWLPMFEHVAGFVNIPDADAQGRIAALRRHAWLIRHGVRSLYVDLFPDRWDGYDIADAVDDGSIRQDRFWTLVRSGSQPRLYDVVVAGDVTEPAYDGTTLRVPATKLGLRFGLAHPIRSFSMSQTDMQLAASAESILTARDCGDRLRLTDLVL